MQLNLFNIFGLPVVKAFAKTRLPKLDGDLKFQELQNPVEVIRDERGVPHIYAQDLADLFFAQGYIHAQDRFWQMEFSRRLVAGRLSEILGPIAVQLDRWIRTLTLRRVAEFEASLLSEKARTLLQSYANGVNAFISTEKLPLEFIFLNYQPEKWRIADTLSWVKMMAWSLSVNWEAELLRAKLIAHLGPEKAAELEPPHLSRWPLIIPPGTDYSRLNFSTWAHTQQIRPFQGPSPYEGLGSNNWALSGDFTSTGKPILANDMHLGMGVPSIWYENHLCTIDFSFTGVTFPGIPGVVSGHNGCVAWGFTNGFPDVQDLYFENIRRASDGSIESEYNGKWEKATVFNETILVNNQKPVIHEVVITRHGPIINELAPELAGEQALALKWTALDPDVMIETMFDIACAKSLTEFRQALKTWTTPAQNVVYADTVGNIGYTLAGKIPVRKKGRGKTPVPGWTDEYEWFSYIPFEMLPTLENPSQGYIVTANNRVFDSKYPIEMELEPISGDRAQRISELILNPIIDLPDGKIDLEYNKVMQFDQCSPSARLVSRVLGSLKIQDSAHHVESELNPYLSLFRHWDGVLSAQSPEASIYEVFIRKLTWLLLNSRLDPETQGANLRSTGKKGGLTQRFMGLGPTPILAQTSIFGERWLPWLLEQLNDPASPWFEIQTGAKREDLIFLALNQSVEYLKKRFGGDYKQWQWGKIHQLAFSHSLGSNPLIGKIFNLGPFPIGGDHSTVWATGSNYHNLENPVMVGPPYRMIIDLSDLDRSVSILAPGQSGNPASPHYNDQIKAWFRGDYFPMYFSRELVEQHARHRLTLSPG